MKNKLTDLEIWYYERSNEKICLCITYINIFFLLLLITFNFFKKV